MLDGIAVAVCLRRTMLTPRPEPANGRLTPALFYCTVQGPRLNVAARHPALVTGAHINIAQTRECRLERDGDFECEVSSRAGHRRTASTERALAVLQSRGTSQKH